MYWKPNRPGRPKAVNEDELDNAIEELKEGAFTDGAELRRERFPTANPRTIRLSLCRKGMCGFVRHRKVRMTPYNFQERLQWARNHYSWGTAAGWSRARLVFSDECKFIVGGSDGLRWCRRERGVDVLSERTVSQRDRRGLGTASVFVWGSMTRRGPGNLVKIDERMDRWLYIGILEVRSLCFLLNGPF